MKRTARYILRLLRLNFCGLVVGTIFYCLALTPSLLPRPPLFEGLIAGVSFAFGYSLGVLISWLYRQTIRKEPPARLKHIAWYAALVAIPIFIVAYGFWAASWQDQVRSLLGEQKLAGRHIFTIFLVAFVVASILIAWGRCMGWAVRLASKVAGHWLPARISAVVGMIVVTTLLVLFYNGVLVRAFVTTSNNIYRGRNDKTAPGITQPTSSLRAGGPQSLVTWQSLGWQGRSFVGSGPTKTQLQRASEQPAAAPIRVYVGLQSAKNAQARAALAVKELERTGAFDRPVLAVMTATGTGWIEPQSADSLEYIWNGNTALVAIQYSYLPSWISFLVDQQNATDAGRALFEAVYAKWRQLPADHRPKLIAYGLSLGSYGAQAAFSGVSDMQNRTSGALFMGSPNNSQPWGDFTRHRDAGSPQWQPQYQGGQVIRFAASASDLDKPGVPWHQPRVVYLQHASDPVVWWNADLIWHKPDWLKEQRGPDVSPNFQWYPFVTFAQVTVDQFFATSAPLGHGHNYGNTEVAAWAAVVPPEGWTPAQTQRIQNIINAYPD